MNCQFIWSDICFQLALVIFHKISIPVKSGYLQTCILTTSLHCILFRRLFLLTFSLNSFRILEATGFILFAISKKGINKTQIEQLYEKDDIIQNIILVSFILFILHNFVSYIINLLFLFILSRAISIQFATFFILIWFIDLNSTNATI